MTNAINAERIKLLSTKSPYWCVGIVVVLGILIAVLVGFADSSLSASEPLLGAPGYLIGVTQFGVLVLMIMAVLAVTSEYRFGTIRTTFQAIPARSSVMYAKAVVYGGVSFVVTLVLAFVAVPLGKALAGDRSSQVDLLGGDAVRQYWGVPVYMALCVLIGLGVGAIVRQSAGAIVIVLIWPLALELILSSIPKVKVVAPYLPFNNASRFLAGGSDVNNSGGSIDYPWNDYGSLIYFAVWAIGLFAVGIVLTNRRDA
ncbi:ABC transporter permease [Williamsia herbipolensis]|uniref:ABC transporter permease n=1 Tax=Williamsia herbipolensis TaxID=1603258 RepID=A0AAU4K8P9_9NOCA|nr:ABC transporter permease [Williamsia herbipolensis]